MVKTHPLALLRSLAGKYKHAVIVLLIGVALMILPTGDRAAPNPVETVPVRTEESDLESRLSAILSRVSGAGEVEVLLTVCTGGETLYQTDEDTDSGETNSRKNVSTVIVEDESNQELGLVRRTDPPVYQGAVVVCQGADDPQVKLAIVEAVSCATGLGADKIKVVKMK